MFSCVIRINVPSNYNPPSNFDISDLSDLPLSSGSTKTIELAGIFLSDHSSKLTDYRTICYAHKKIIEWIKPVIQSVHILEDNCTARDFDSPYMFLLERSFYSFCSMF